MKWFVTLLVVCSCSFSAHGQKVVHLGGKNFTEQFLLVNITEKYLQSKGFQVKSTSGLGTVVMRKALEAEQLDLVWDYTGTGLIVYFHVQEKLTGMASYEKVKELDKPNNMIWLKPSLLDNGYALTMQREVAEKEGIKSIEDLSNFIKSRQKDEPKKKNLFAVDYEFASRPDGLKPLQIAYDFEFHRSDIKQMDPGLVYTALKNGQVLVGLAFTSDGRIQGFDLVSLEDNRRYFPSYYATPVVRKAVLQKYPELEQLMQDLTDRLDTEKMMNLNKRVDIDHLSIEKVADDFLKSEGLIK